MKSQFTSWEPETRKHIAQLRSSQPSRRSARKRKQPERAAPAIDFMEVFWARSQGTRLRAGESNPRRLQRGNAALLVADPNCVIDLRQEDLAVTDLAGGRNF